MTQPYKVCPQCGQPAVLEMQQCRRCGFSYVPSVPLSPSQAQNTTLPGMPQSIPLSPVPIAPRPIERSRAEQNRTRNRALLGTLLGLLLIAGVTAGLVRWLSAPPPMPEGGLALAPQQTRPILPPALPSVPANSEPDTSLPSHPGMFVERESIHEMPTLHVTNLEDDVMILTLQDMQGHTYRVTSSHRQTANLQVPPGDYQVSLESNDPRIGTTYGDAIFRRRKEYDAVFHHGHDTEPIHLGD